jgi:acetylornithine deacetylase/succinyl-diaminopimelate desuccinylase-like protein
MSRTEWIGTFALNLLLIIFSTSSLAQSSAPAKPLPPHDKLLREIYQELIEINTTDSVGDCTQASNAMAARLKAGGYSDAEMQVIVPPGGPKKGNLVARLKGTGAKKPLMLLAHIDVVEAKREDWVRDPFKLIEEGGYFYARGVSDDKAMAAIHVSNMIRYKQEKMNPARDIILALTCDEEHGDSKFNGVVHLLKNHRNLIDAEIVINEGGGGVMDKNGKPQFHAIQAGEKIFQNFQLEVTNPGGHSSAPKRDNAIYHLAEALAKLSKFEFPFKLSPITRAYFERRAAMETNGPTPAIAADMRGILKDPPDLKAMERLTALSPTYNAAVRTTCVATMVDAGHASNALPQRARATVNCRILPGEKVADVQATLARLIADPKVNITAMGNTVEAALPPLTPELMKAVESITADMWPGIPVIPNMIAGGTDGRFLNNAGIWTYGISGIFTPPEGSNAHGLNEKLPVKSLYEGHEFLYRLGKKLG